ncbi:MAG TPA: twitch domain-containing radical SAM protein [Flavilitoribacter sp.]|nr:twitch domain-containing radical SAM protein [Flavilitoribacter sp.]HMQ87374.1 twitch domain-containing radical SAM protein [Flavilitoribacter sp.]
MSIKLEDIVKGCKDEHTEMYLCMFPFFHMYNDSKGKWALCCDSTSFDYSVNEFNSSEHFDHPEMHQIRQEMLTGKLDKARSMCALCLNGEKMGLKTKRTEFNRFILNRRKPEENPLFQFITDYGNGKRADPFPGHRILDVKLRIFGNTCNLSCYMCQPFNSSSRIQELKKIRDGYWFDHVGGPTAFKVFDSADKYEDFVKDIHELIPFIRSIRIIGGEPFLLKKHYEFLDMVIATGHSEHIMLHYQTNLTKFDVGRERTAKYFNHFDSIRMLVSLDGVGPTNDYIRFGGNFDEIMDNIRYLKSHTRINMAIDTVISILNAGIVTDILSYFEEADLDVDLNLLTSPDFLQTQHLPEEIKELYRRRIMDSPYLEKLGDMLNMMNREADPQKFQKFLAYIYDLDEARGTNLIDLWPEFQAYYNPAIRELVSH